MPVVRSVHILSVAKIGVLFGIVMGWVWGDFLRTYRSLREGMLRPAMVWSGERGFRTRCHANFWGNHGVYQGSDPRIV